MLDVVCERLMAPGAERVRPVWLDPLPPMLPLDAIIDVDVPGEPATVRAVLGLVDEPAKQRQFPLEWDFAGAAGNVMVLGAPQSGKSMLLRTLIGSLGLRYAPGDVVFYCLDFGGGTLRGWPERAARRRRDAADGPRADRSHGQRRPQPAGRPRGPVPPQRRLEHRGVPPGPAAGGLDRRGRAR